MAFKMKGFPTIAGTSPAKHIITDKRKTENMDKHNKLHNDPDYTHEELAPDFLPLEEPAPGKHTNSPRKGKAVHPGPDGHTAKSHRETLDPATKSIGSPAKWGRAKRLYNVIKKLIKGPSKKPTRQYRPNEPQRGARNPDGTRR